MKTLDCFSLDNTKAEECSWSQSDYDSIVSGMSSSSVFCLSCYYDVFCLLGLAGPSRQEEGQQRVSRGDDISWNGKHKNALPVYCLQVFLWICCFVHIFCCFQSNHIQHLFYTLMSVFPSLVSWCPVFRYQTCKQHPVLPNCMPSRWKARGIVCRKSMRLSTRGHWSTSKRQCGLSMDKILKRACKNKYASGLLSVGKPYWKITDTVF